MTTAVMHRAAEAARTARIMDSGERIVLADLMPPTVPLVGELCVQCGKAPAVEDELCLACNLNWRRVKAGERPDQNNPANWSERDRREYYTTQATVGSEEWS